MIACAKATATKPARLRVGDCAVYEGDNLAVLKTLRKDSVRLIYIDPPFNTGKQQRYNKIKTTRTDGVDGGARGYGGRRYNRQTLSQHSYADAFTNYIDFLGERVAVAYDLLQADGSFFLHVDYREVHYCKVMMDGIFGCENFINEIIWSYDYGARSKRKWSTKHDNILWFAKNKSNYVFNYDAIDRIPYMAPGLVGADKARRGKTPTDVWWNSIVGTNSRERAAGGGYPTQKPLAILERIILTHSQPGDTVLDFFAGSGTTGVAAAKHNRRAILIDSNPIACATIKQRLKKGDV